MIRRIDEATSWDESSTEENPFLRYRRWLYSYGFHLARGRTDAAFVHHVRGLDDEVRSIAGTGFHVTPCERHESLETAVLPHGEIWIKDETANVSGSHKGRHLFGVALSLLSPEALASPLSEAPLAIASCGNAALAAAVVARAAGRDLEVFVPNDAKRGILDRLRMLGARVHVCERQDGETGDPCVRGMHEAIREGSLPFTVQARENAQVLDGGVTLGSELVSAMLEAGRPFDRIFVQVGGGALASSIALALAEARAAGAIVTLPRIHAVQTRGCHPLERAYTGLLRAFPELASASDSTTSSRDRTAVPPDMVAAVLEEAARDRRRFMRPWDSVPRSRAHGILDDETYDWLPIVRGMLESGGGPVVVEEDELERAESLVPQADATGAAALAGLVHARSQGLVGRGESVAVLVTGARRGQSPFRLGGSKTEGPR